MHGAGFDQTLRFGIRGREVQSRQQPREPHRAGGNRDLLRLDVLGILPLPEHTIEFVARCIRGFSTVVIGDDARCKIGFHVLRMTLAIGNVLAKVLDFIQGDVG